MSQKSELKMTDSCVQVELIPFANPSEASLYIPKIKWTGEKWDLMQIISQKFGQFGLLFKVSTGKCQGNLQYEATSV